MSRHAWTIPRMHLTVEKHDAVADLEVSGVTAKFQDDPWGAENAADEAICCATPTKHVAHGLESWQAYIAQTVKTYIKLAPEPRTQACVAEVMEASEVNQRKGLEQEHAARGSLPPAPLLFPGSLLFRVACARV